MKSLTEAAAAPDEARSTLASASTTENSTTSNNKSSSTSCSSRKRKRPTSADTFSRIADSSCDKVKSGRGSEAGWVNCPLCGRHSRKKFAMGRGIAAHLHAVHTPWNPGKVERQKRRRIRERKLREFHNKTLLQQENDKPECNTTTSSSSCCRQPWQQQQQQPSELPNNGHDQILYQENHTWEPTEKEAEEWNQRVLQIVKELEEQHSKISNDNEEKDPPTSTTQSTNSAPAGVDRNGKEIKSYRSSLPPFVQAAANGDLASLKEMVEAKEKDTENEILELLNGRDRHLSTAEHWAAGSGHLECLKYLHKVRDQIAGKESCVEKQKEQRKKIRRRDGKTALHYAARNGHVECINYLIQVQGHAVDEKSGDGTTPFHLACFGGHIDAIKALIQKHGADPLLANDFDCNAGHWIGMTKCESVDIIRKMCRLLQQAGVSFVHRQKQGHTCLHKAAQRQNRHVIEWMAQSLVEGGAGLSSEENKAAGEPDEGGHVPSEIWRSVGGAVEFADWMQRELGW